MTFSVTRRRVTNANLLEYASKNRNEGLFNDVTFIAGNEMIPANRLVLSCHSKYFEGMFKLTHENVIEIEAVDGTTMKALIDFIYTGSITIDDRNVESLQSGAEYFKINEVKQFCDEFVLEKSKLQDSFAHFKTTSLNKEVEMKDDIWKSHLIRLGGLKERKKVNVVLSLSQDTHREYADFDVRLGSHCSLMLNDHIYTMGGRYKRGDDFYTTNEVVKLNLKDENAKWEKVVSMNKKRYTMGASVYRDTLFVAGGSDQNFNSIASCEYYVTESNKWKYAHPLIQCRDAHALVSCDECLYALGGYNTDDYEYLASVEKLTHLDGEWQNIQPMQTPRQWFPAVNCNGVVYAIGGQSGKENSAVLKSVEKYDPAGNQWKYVSDMNIARSSHAACVLRDKIYVAGGLQVAVKNVKEIECYDPVNDAWSIVGNAINVLRNHTLVAC